LVELLHHDRIARGGRAHGALTDDECLPRAGRRQERAANRLETVDAGTPPSVRDERR
jgi:hypothetical protein